MVKQGITNRVSHGKWGGGSLERCVGSVYRADDSLRASRPTTLGSIFSSVIMTSINPHRLGLAGSLKSAFAVKVYRTAVGDGQWFNTFSSGDFEGRKLLDSMRFKTKSQSTNFRPLG